GRRERIRAATARVRSALPPTVEAVAEMPYLAIQTMFDEESGWGHRSYAKGGYANDLPAEAWRRLADHARSAPAGDSFAIWTQGGAVADVDDDAMAFTGRHALFDVSADT